MSNPYLIGYCGPEGKWHRMGWNSIVECGKRHNFIMKHIDLNQPIEEQGNFSLIIHKLTYQMTNGEDLEVKRFSDYCQKHPNVVIIDPLGPVSMTLDRQKMTDACSRIQYPNNLGFNVKVPKTIIVDSNEPEILDSALAQLKFPILAKPKLAGSVESAHILRLCTTRDHLLNIPTPTILQEYINHGGIIYKCYALGDHLEVGCRPSTRDVFEGETIEIDFHSQHSNDPNGMWAHPENLDKIHIPYERFILLSSILRSQLNIQLLGFDILIDHNDDYWLVDINYFPGYKNVQNLDEKFCDFILKQLKQ